MRKKRAKILSAVHATARGLRAADAIYQETMREFDQLCLKPARPLPSRLSCFQAKE
jgi:putative transcriptional regulator